MQWQTYQRSTDEVGERHRFDYWRDAICDAYVPLDPCTSAHDRRFAGRIDGVDLGDLHASTIQADAHEVSLHPRGIARRGGNPFYANLIVSGVAHVRQHGQEGLARAGDVYVVDCTEPWEVSFRERFAMFCVEIDEALLRPRLGVRGRLEVPVLSGQDGAGRVLSHYLNLLRGLPAGDLAPMQSLMVDHCSELLVRAQLAGREERRGDRARLDLMQRLRAFVERHLREAGLGPEQACDALNVSRSYLFKALAAEGTSFAALLREARLQAARRALRDVRARPVSVIAADVGFSSASTFSRAYRARFGEAPNQGRGMEARAGVEPTYSDLQSGA